MDYALTYSRFNILSSDVRSYYRRTSGMEWYLRFLNWISDRLKKKMLEDYTRLNTDLLGIAKVVEEHAAELSNEDYEVFQRVVSLLSGQNGRFRELNYFDSEDLRILMNDTLQLSFEIEADIKLAVLSRQPRVKEDQSYFKSLSERSHNAISEKLASGKK